MDFIEELAGYVIKYAHQYGICVHSPIIAQGILESASGTSNKVKIEVDGKTEWRHNYFGLKWRNNRCEISNDYFEEWTAEQNKDGSYKNIVSKFCKFKSLEECVIGYFQWTNIPNYSNLKGVTDPETYLKNIKEDKYATSKNYVQNLMNVIKKYDLTKYDQIAKEEPMSRSSLVDYVKISPNSSNPRDNKIKKITIHHMAGNLTVEGCGNVFQNKNRQASSNYGVDSNGRVGLYVEEENRAWTSSNRVNDNQAVTIEVANDGGDPDWHVSDKALAKTIWLCVDICRRNCIDRLNFTGDSSGNLTMHKMFTATTCPGPYLESKMQYIANEVNKILSDNTESNDVLYRVQVGAYGVKENAERKLKELKSAGFDGFIVEVKR